MAGKSELSKMVQKRIVKAQALAQGDDVAKMVLEVELRLDRLEAAAASRRAAARMPKGIIREVCGLPSGKMGAEQARVWGLLGLLAE